MKYELQCETKKTKKTRMGTRRKNVKHEELQVYYYTGFLVVGERPTSRPRALRARGECRAKAARHLQRAREIEVDTRRIRTLSATFCKSAWYALTNFSEVH